jgi:glycosyltransferase involved in cell wall biosynthesis
LIERTEVCLNKFSQKECSKKGYYNLLKGSIITLKIALDVTPLVKEGKGVARYILNFLKALASAESNNEYYIYIRADYPLTKLPQKSNFHYQRVRTINSFLWGLFQFPKELIMLKPHIIHVFVEKGPLWGRGKLVVTAHEWPGLRSHPGVNRGIYAYLSKKYGGIGTALALRKASKIVADSQFTKKAFLVHYNILNDKIQVTYGAPDGIFRPLVEKDIRITKEKYGLYRPTILHIASSDPRDNTDFVLEATAKLKENLCQDIRLVVVGKIPFQQADNLKSLGRELGLQDAIVFTGYVSDEELVKIYNAADVYVHPAMYEGFGLQVAEAMACGTPVIAFNNTSIPEVIGKAGILVDTNDIDEFTEALEGLLLNETLQARFRERGLKRVRGLSWDRYVTEILDIYQEVVKGC